jgi:hypothetical protein
MMGAAGDAAIRDRIIGKIGERGCAAAWRGRNSRVVRHLEYSGVASTGE